MYNNFDKLLADIAQSRPSKKSTFGPVFYFSEHPVSFMAGEMEGVHWMDIQIELPRFRMESLQAAKKVLQANREMGMATPIPTWFALSEKGDCLVFINRLDWRHVTAKVVEDHVLRCIEQMSAALATEGV